MAKKQSDEVLNLDVNINGNQAQAELVKLEKAQKQLKQTNTALQAEKAKLIIQNKKGTEEWKRANKALEENRAQMKVNAAEMDKLIGKIGHTGLTVTQLKKEATNLRRSISNMIPNTPEVRQKEKELRALEARIDKVDITSRRARTSLNRMNSNAVTGFKSAGKALSNYVLGYATMLLSITAIGRKWLSVNTEFQKFDAVLTTATGSAEAAAGEMATIEEIAASTPFSVRELTEAFVKLNNQGFRPTREEMILMGDLAASTGKTFDQLAEAILDAQVGEFERLKEFGIKAKTEGDKVIFTFKGVRTEVDKNAEAIQQYMLSLGSLEGVAGSMESISQTLGGAISNLGDSWDILMKSFSDGDGVITRSIGKLSEFLSVLSKGVQAGGLVTAHEIEQAVNAGADIYEKGMERITTSVQNQEKSWEDWQQSIKESIQESKNLLSSTDNLSASQTLLLNEKIKAYEQLAAAVNANIDAELKAEQKKEAELEEKRKEAAAKALKIQEKATKEEEKAVQQLADFLKGIREEDLTAIQKKYADALALLEKYYSDEKELTEAQEELKAQIKAKYEDELKVERLQQAQADQEAEQARQLALMESSMQQLYDHEQLLLLQQREEQKLTKEEFDREMENLEYQHLQRMLDARKLMGEDTIELEKQIAQAKIKANADQAEANEKLNESNAEAAAQAAFSAGMQAKSAEDAKSAILNAIRDIIAAKIAEAITTFVADQVASQGWVGLITGAAAAAAAGALFSAVVPAFDGGLYDVIDQNGSQYKATRNENLSTGLYTTPQVSYSKNMLVAEKRPELVVDGLTTRKLINFRPDIIKTIMDMRNGNPQQVQAYDGGKYPSMPSDSAMAEALQINNAIMGRLAVLLENGVNANIGDSKIREVKKKMEHFDKIEKQA